MPRLGRAQQPSRQCTTLGTTPERIKKSFVIPPGKSKITLAACGKCRAFFFLNSPQLPPAETASIRSVHLQQSDRRASYRSPPYNHCPVLFKVVIPLVLARIKQPHQRPAFLINPAQVRTLVQIAVVTREREIFTVVSAAVPAGYDVLDVVSKEGLRLLRHSAILAAMTCPFSDKLSEWLADQAA
jgi:hypothetical protein